jgi:hypothetical protein
MFMKDMKEKYECPQDRASRNDRGRRKNRLKFEKKKQEGKNSDIQQSKPEEDSPSRANSSILQTIESGLESDRESGGGFGRVKARPLTTMVSGFFSLNDLFRFRARLPGSII